MKSDAENGQARVLTTRNNLHYYCCSWYWLFTTGYLYVTESDTKHGQAHADHDHDKQY
jgi:hypothetical protein